MKMTEEFLRQLAEQAGFAVRRGEIFSRWREDIEINYELMEFAKLVLEAASGEYSGVKYDY